MSPARSTSIDAAGPGTALISTISNFGFVFGDVRFRDGQVLIDGRLEEAARKAGVLVEAGLNIERRPADVVLLRPKGNLLARLDGAEPGVAPATRQLTREPGVGQLADAERAAVIEADEHEASVSEGFLR